MTKYLNGFMILLWGSLGHSQIGPAQSLSPFMGDHKSQKGFKPEGARQGFEAALELFKAGKWIPASQGFEQILARYPGYQPAIIFLAKTYYRLDRIRDAYPYFSKLSPGSLDPETSYEYGYTFYSARNYEGCLKGLKNITEGHSLYDLAQYYAGVCHLKLKHYREAEASFEKAMVLPDRLAKSRSLYLKHLDTILVHQESTQLAEERKAILKEPKQPKSGPKKRGTEKTISAAVKNKEPPSYQGFKGPGKSANLTFATENQTIHYNGNKQETFESNSGTFSLSTTPVVYLPKLKDRFGAVGISFGLEASSATIKGKQERILLDERDDSIQRQLTNTLPTKDEKKGSFSIEPWIEVPIPPQLWAAVSVSVRMDYPEFERGQRSGTQQVTGSLGGKNDAWGYGTQVNYKQLIDPENSPTTQVVGMQVHGAYDVSELMALSGILRYENYNYPDPDKKISGPDSVIWGEADIVQSFPLGFSIRIAGMIDTEINKLFYDMPTYEVIPATGTNYTGLGSLLYGSVPGGPPYPGRSGRPPKMLSFIDGGITVKARQTIWKVSEREMEEVFKLNVPNYVEQVQAEINVGLLF
jgi:tetratricopeptide (TPR) repeat protein